MFLHKQLATSICAGLLFLAAASCNKKRGEDPVGGIRYYQVGSKKTVPTDWRDTAFVVATADPQLQKEIAEQLKIPVAKRRMVSGALVAGSGGYNRNASHEFKWHFREDDWHLTDASIEVQDGRAYSDVDQDTAYYLHNIKRFAPWSSFIRKEVPAR